MSESKNMWKTMRGIWSTSRLSGSQSQEASVSSLTGMSDVAYATLTLPSSSTGLCTCSLGMLPTPSVPSAISSTSTPLLPSSSWCSSLELTMPFWTNMPESWESFGTRSSRSSASSSSSRSIASAWADWIWSRIVWDAARMLSSILSMGFTSMPSMLWVISKDSSMSTRTAKQSTAMSIQASRSFGTWKLYCTFAQRSPLQPSRSIRHPLTSCTAMSCLRPGSSSMMRRSPGMVTALPFTVMLSGNPSILNG
mmetsp:Transcript_42618/g.110130  ORF Transcript_42618/g.110130 Transcript_42618/m.110130 type:complete len:252 (-) Transcript_42618:1133-1888(-)